MTSGLFQAVHDCRYLQAKFFLESGININCKNRHGENLLIAAILRINDPVKRTKMMKWLMTIGVDVSEKDNKYGRDAITWVAFFNRTDDVKVILRSKEEDIKLTQVDIFGRTALHYATLHNNIEVVQMLCKRFQRYHVSVDIRDVNHITPYIIAVKLQHTACAETLREVGRASASQVTEGFFKASNIWNGFQEFTTGNESTRVQSKLPNRLPMVATLAEAAQKDSASIAQNNDIKSFSAVKRQHTAKTSKTKSTHLSFRSLEDFSSWDSGPNDKIRKKQTRPKKLPEIYQSMQNMKHPQLIVQPNSNKSYQKTVMPAVFSILSQQASESYVPPVKPPKPDTPPPKPRQSKGGISFGVLGNVSKFAAILKKKSNKKL